MIQPIRTQVLIKPYPSDEMSEGGIIVPLTAQKPSNKVKVIKVGNGTKEKPMKLKEGQTAYRVKDSGCAIDINGDIHYLVEQDAILATES